LLETAITKGFRAAVAFDVGVLLADATFILIVYFTTSSLLREIKDDPKLFFVGGLIMMAYGIISFIKLKKDFKKTIDNKENAHLVVPEKVNYIALFIKGFLLNFINIGVLGFWLGFIEHVDYHSAIGGAYLCQGSGYLADLWRWWCRGYFLAHALYGGRDGEFLCAYYQRISDTGLQGGAA